MHLCRLFRTSYLPRYHTGRKRVVFSVLLHNILILSCYVLGFLVVINFAQKVSNTVDALGPNARFPPDENGFIHASTLVYDGVRDIRRAVLMARVRSHDPN